ncbi:MAG: sigma-70 family polymerase sigma factor [Gammaproteobacteria bacterium]|nr:sigma-70 family polymerase sigma factor [Gammaproteobacteria bacterium]
MHETLHFSERLTPRACGVQALASQCAPSCSRPPIPASTLAKLFLENNRSLCAYLRVRVASQHEAEDIAQEAFARLLQHEQPHAISFLRAYLFRMAANIANDRARQRRLHLRIDLAHSWEEQIESATPDEQMHAAEQLSLLARALSELPEKYRRAFLLCRLQEWDTNRIAADLEVGERMARNYVRRTARYCQLRLDGATPREARREVIP